MWGPFGMFMLAAVTGIQPASADAMNNREQQHHCRLIGAERLPSGSGGGDALCAAVERAVAERAPNIRYTAEISVVSRSSLAARLTVNGRLLPDQKFGVSDRDLNRESIRRFAAALALAAAEAGEQ